MQNWRKKCFIVWEVARISEDLTVNCVISYLTVEVVFSDRITISDRAILFLKGEAWEKLNLCLNIIRCKRDTPDGGIGC